MRLEDLRIVFGGPIRQTVARRWLDTRVGGLRACVMCRSTSDPRVAFDLAIYTANACARDPYFGHVPGSDGRLDEELALPRLDHGFVFTGCRRGVLFTRSTDDASLDGIVAPAPAPAPATAMHRCTRRSSLAQGS